MQRIQSRKQIIHFLGIFLVIAAIVSCASSDELNAPVNQKKLVVVGGGTPIEDIRRSFLDLSPVQDLNLLIIPYASSNPESSGQRNTERFKELGVEQVTVLDLDYADQALDDIKNSDLIWFPGGGQSRLMSALKERSQGAVVNAIREKVASGTPIGGTSAGAAVMSEVMIANSYRDEDTGVLTPRISEGLGLWPKVIVDQHFSERNRLERLEIAVNQNPDLIGVGIDERTAVLYNGEENRFRVMGEGTVTILRATSSDTELEKTILEAGDFYQFTNNLES